MKTPMEPKTVICQGCGVEFQTMGRYAKFCPDCRKMQSRRKKHDYYVRQRAMAQGKTEEEIRAEDEKVERLKANAGSLDSKLRECHANGQSYAEAQRAETIEAFARVTAPEPSEPEAPAERSRKMYLSAKEREALVKVQTEAEVLMEYFKAPEGDSLDYPGIILGRIAEQVGELLKEAEA